jgi:membrane protein implicated in regulation of membrane protease activity
MAVIGSTIYPPAMGLLSVTVGLTVAMLGSAALAIVCVLALWAFSRATVQRSHPQPLTQP